MISQLANLPGIGVLLGLLLVLNYVVPAILSPLRNVKGPAVARFSRFWEIFETWRGRLEQVTIALHEQYGELSEFSTMRIIR